MNLYQTYSGPFLKDHDDIVNAKKYFRDILFMVLIDFPLRE